MFKHKALKGNEKDAALPATRWELFRTVIKDDFYLLAELSVLMFLFSLPLGIAFAAELVLLGGIGSVTGAKVFSLCFYMGLAEIPLFGVRYIGRYAAFGVMKKRAFNEAGLIKETFFSVMKKGAGRGFFDGCIVGLVAFVWQIACVFVITFNTEAALKGLGIGGSTLLFLIVFAACESFLAVDNYYELPFRGSIKNGFSFAFAAFPWALLYFAVSMVVPLVLTWLSTYALIGVAAVWALWLDGVTVLAVTLFSHGQFYKYINSIYYIDYINKGLSVKEKERNDG